MLKSLKSKRRRISKLPPPADTADLDTSTQGDIFSQEFKENINEVSLDTTEDSFFEQIDWDSLDQQNVVSSSGFSAKDRAPYKSPVLKTPNKPVVIRCQNKPHDTPIRPDTNPVHNALSPVSNALKSPITPKIPSTGRSNESFGSSMKSIFQTPERVQRKLYSTGLVSPYTTGSNERTRLGVPEEVFKLLDKIRGIKKLYPWQEETVNTCLSGGNHIFTCPTSGGKTLVGELLLLNAVLMRDVDAMLILPYVALVDEKVRELAEFAEHFSFSLERYAGSRGKLPPRKRRKKRSIYVATIEKANSLVNSLCEEARGGEVGVVVVDELHMLGDGSRGAILETCLAKLLFHQPSPRIIGMTATLNNHSEISSFLRCSYLVGGARPVELEEAVKIGDQMYNVGADALVPLRKVSALPPSQDIKSSLRDGEGVAALVQEVFPTNSVLVFCPTKKSCETTARMLASIIQSSKGDAVDTARSDLLTRLRSETGHVDDVLATTLPCGISYHHSGLTSDERQLIEEAFCLGTLGVLCCTSTLAAGVNLPASRVIIRSVKLGMSYLTRTRYLQMVGRAGRTGLVSKGDSILLGKESEAHLVNQLVFGTIESVMSCLDKDTLTLTLLHLVGSGMIRSAGDVGMFMKRTLLYIQQPNTCLDSAEGALRTLQERNFLTRKDGAIVTTAFGKAVYKSSLDPAIAGSVIQTLDEANKYLVLLGDLHLVYLSIPPINILDNIYIDWMTYFTACSSFDEVYSMTFNAVGLREGYLAKRAVCQNSGDVAKEVPYKKFYLAGALMRMLCGDPTWVVAERFKIPRGTLQSALQAANSHASKLSQFTKELPKYWALSAVFEALVSKLFFAASPELANLLELPGIRHARAKQLYSAGYTSLQQVAAAEPKLLSSDIEHLTEKQAQKIISSAKIMLREQADALTDAALQLLEQV